MPNLQQIISLRKKYGEENNVSSNELQLLNESFNEKSIEIRSKFSGNSRIRNLINYFESQQTADVVLLFIDITNFSNICKDFNNSELSIYLDIYYDKVISTIYRHGGEVEKIIGDGIICVFGQPFLNDMKINLFDKADSCAKDIIIDLKGTNSEVKIALTDGKIMYYKNKTENYPEYTMIGKALTELFRLESISANNSINYFYMSMYEALESSESGLYLHSQNFTHSKWEKSGNIKISNLKGVDWSYIKQFCCTYKT